MGLFMIILLKILMWYVNMSTIQICALIMDSDDEFYCEKTAEPSNLLLTKTTYEIARLDPYR